MKIWIYIKLKVKTKSENAKRQSFGTKPDVKVIITTRAKDEVLLSLKHMIYAYRVGQTYFYNNNYNDNNALSLYPAPPSKIMLNAAK